MGTKIHCKSYLPGFYSMRDLNEDSSSSSWPLFYGDKTAANGQYYNGYMPRTLVDNYPGHEKNTLKQKMLEHESVFKNQVCELHRLYRIQRDMMDEVKRKELHKRASMEPASSSSLQGSQMPSEDARKWHMAGFPLSNSSYGKTTIAGVENFSSPVSCTKGNTTQPGQFPFQNGSTSKDSEALDSRPSKVRKKLFDLQLPADEYVDSEEKENFREYKESDPSSYIPNGNPNGAPESSMKLFPGGHVGLKTDRPMDASASTPCLRGSVGLADLNEPIQIEEATASSSIDFLGHTSENVDTKAAHQPAKSTPGYLGVPGETMHVCDGFSIKSSIESQVDERGWLSHMNKAGYSRGNLSSVMQPDKSPLPSHPEKGMINQAYHPRMYPSCYSREDLWREGFRHGYESSARSYDHSNNSHFEPIASQTPGSYPFFSSSSFASSWVQSVPSWTKPTASYTQKLTALEQSSALSQEPFGTKWHANSSTRLNPGFGSESKLNGFYHATASGSKELQFKSPSAGYDYLNCSRGVNEASDRSTNHGFGNFPKGSCGADIKPAIDINLNEALPKSLSNETVNRQDLNMADGKGKPEDNPSALPWLKSKPAHVNEVFNSGRSELSRELSYLHASSNQLCCKNEAVRDLNQLFASKVPLAPCDSESPRKKEIARTQTVRKILGFPIFDERDVPENERSSHASTSVIVDCQPELKTVSTERKNGIIDINVACEPDEQIVAEELTVEKEKQKNGASIKHYIDLNSCLSDSEDPPAPCCERKSASVKITLEIDLEVPLLLESEDDSTVSKEKMPDDISLQSLENRNEQLQDEVLRNAVETILAMSSCPQIHTEDSICLPSEAAVAEALLWFADAVSSYPNEIVNTSGKESRVGDGSWQQDSSEEIDDFEAMTLQLAETKEDDYMPKPFVPEIQKFEETGANALTTRSRRGHARRGRQRRDFQRDILPGLTSLSRHEVTEDLQTFGGLMRATGHSWNAGLTRRNGTRTRGRRRAVVETVPPAISSPVCTPLIQQLSNIEAGLEDRSLTGWGKTTRRPRRQRCPAGNPPTVVLT